MAVSSKEKERRDADAERLNRSHRTRKLSILQPRDHVWISDAKESRTVVASHSAPRSYVVNTQQGTVRHNRHHLVKMQAEAMEDNSETPDPLDQHAANMHRPHLKCLR